MRLVHFVLMWSLSVVLNGQSTDKQRKRLLRILLFPRGSSLQLVYCLTIPTVNMPNIFVVGVTGSLAWELPYNPNEPYRKRAELLHRRIDKPASGNRPKQDIRFRPSNYRNTYYHTAYGGGAGVGGSAIMKYPINATYYRGQWNNVEYHDGNKFIPVGDFLNNKLRWEAKRNRMKYLYYRRVYPGNGLNIYDDTRSDYQHPIYNEFHRRSRRDLYAKIEKFLDTIKMNGKVCVLKMLCQVSKIKDGGGTFMEEIMKRIFRNKQSYYETNPDHYDQASLKENDCDYKYPECEYS